MLQPVRIAYAKLKGTARRAIVRAWDPIGDGDDEQIGDVAMLGSLGVTALPADPDADGASARGALARIGDFFAVIVGWDNRTSDIVGNLLAGDTCLHGTGPAHGSRLYMKEGAVELVITGDDSGPSTLLTIDQKGGKLQLFFDGHAIEMTGGATGSLRYDHPSGTSGITVKAGQVRIRGKLLVGNNPVFPISTGVSPGVVANPAILVDPPGP